MVKSAFKWAKRVAFVATVVAVVRRVLNSSAGTDQAGNQPVPPVGGDTWPPVPTNPGQKD